MGFWTTSLSSDDTWLAHHEQDDFQSVLAALNVEHGKAGQNMDEDEKKATLRDFQEVKAKSPLSEVS